MRPRLPFTDEIHVRAGWSSGRRGQPLSVNTAKWFICRTAACHPRTQRRELRSFVLRRLHWRSAQSARNLQSIIVLIKPSVTKNKTPFALGRACCQLIANCCVTEWNWDVNTSLRCIPYSHAGSVNCSNSGKWHFIMFVDSLIVSLYYLKPAQGQIITCI